MKWRDLLSWGAVVAGAIILVLAAMEGNWLLVAFGILATVAFMVYGIVQTRRRA